ncbi:alpha/beta hydrolase [Sulfuritalea sp.]|uniref:alpha/beta fold hydrolase n=1 Tax=Sulfuritalea sp. TaxID=2480090 RepID=UPI00286E7D49|nr:alpha/beta hydrolase [Sulfuritalea sp.]
MKSCHSEFLQIRGRRLHVRIWGGESAPLLVLLHGWCDVSASWQFVVDALQKGWRVVAPDWRGFGLSEWNNDVYWFPDYIADLDALLLHYSPQAPVRLVGHSLGGNAACLYAGLRPERICQLVNLEGLGLRRYTPDEAPERYVNWLDQLRDTPSFRSYPDRAAFAARLQKENPRLSDQNAAFLAQHMGEDDGAGGIHLAADPFHRWVNPTIYRVEEAMAIWRRVTAPVLWVTAADSFIFKQLFAVDSADYRSRIACFRDVREVTLEGSGHNLQHDQPQQVARLIEEFFAA